MRERERERKREREMIYLPSVKVHLYGKCTTVTQLKTNTQYEGLTFGRLVSVMLPLFDIR